MSLRVLLEYQGLFFETWHSTGDHNSNKEHIDINSSHLEISYVICLSCAAQSVARSNCEVLYLEKSLFRLTVRRARR